MDNEKIRQFQRREVSWPGVLHVSECDREQVQFASSLANSRDDFTIRVTLVDIGYGGVGIESAVFLPRNLRGTIEVMEPSAEGAGRTTPQLLLTHDVTAKRCRQISREPEYLVGLGFGTTTSEFTQVLEGLMAVTGSGDSARGAGDATGAQPGLERGSSDHA